MAKDICRSGRHIDPPRRNRRDGVRECLLCAREWVQQHAALRPVGRDAWANATVDTERAERFKAWQAGVDDAIATMRETEGFDGTQREWRTLGECLPIDPETKRAAQAQSRMRLVCGRRWKPCDTCQTPIWVGTICPACAGALRERRLVG